MPFGIYVFSIQTTSFPIFYPTTDDASPTGFSGLHHGLMPTSIVMITLLLIYIAPIHHGIRVNTVSLSIINLFSIFVVNKNILLYSVNPLFCFFVLLGWGPFFQLIIYATSIAFFYCIPTKYTPLFYNNRFLSYSSLIGPVLYRRLLLLCCYTERLLQNKMHALRRLVLNVFGSQRNKVIMEKEKLHDL